MTVASVKPEPVVISPKSLKRKRKPQTLAITLVLLVFVLVIAAVAAYKIHRIARYSTLRHMFDRQPQDRASTSTSETSKILRNP